MTREQTDLLNVFRAKPARSTGARAVSRPVVDRRGGDIVLTRRQATLGAAMAGLLLLLAFMGGTAVGRRRTNGMELANVRKPTAPVTVYQFRSRDMSRLSAEGGDLAERAVASFRSAFPRIAEAVTAIPAEDAKGRVMPGKFRLLVRGFSSRSHANEWLFQVKGWQVDGGYPFEDSLPEPAP